MIIKRWEMTCDQGQCSSKVAALFKSDLKARAKGLGWTRTWGLLEAIHTCPNCQAKARTGTEVS